MTQKDKVALITGATSGIGAAFAEKFANQNYDLIITGRREAKIKAFASELMDKYNVKVEVIIVELANDSDLNSLAKKIESLKNLKILINNAGFRYREAFSNADLNTCEQMLKAHVLATMKLTHAALKNMLANKKGTIINVSSIVAFFPIAKSPIYSATKAFISIFTESVGLEIKNTDVHIQALCPGITRTDAFTRIGEDADEIYQKFGWFFKPMSAEAVVEKSLQYLKKNKVVCIPGMRNRLNVTLCALRRLF